jgi:hypothetical protein
LKVDDGKQTILLFRVDSRTVKSKNNASPTTNKGHAKPYFAANKRPSSPSSVTELAAEGGQKSHKWILTRRRKDAETEKRLKEESWSFNHRRCGFVFVLVLELIRETE